MFFFRPFRPFSSALSRIWQTTLCCLLLSYTASVSFAAGPERLGEQFQANTYTVNEQEVADVATDEAGNFVIVWQSFGSDNGDPNSYSVQGQRYASDGTALGSEFRVNTYTTSDQYTPRVARDAEGNFFVVWASLQAPQDSFAGIQAQRYNSNGSPIGTEFRVNQITFDGQYSPDIAMNGDGGFVVVWDSFGPTDFNTRSIQGRRFSSIGAPLGDQFLINSISSGQQRDPRVAVGPAGDFVVVWASQGSYGSDTGDYSIQGQRFASNGNPMGSQFQVNTYVTGRQTYPQVALASDGGFVVAWHRDGILTPNPGSVHARLFASNGTALGDQLEVNAANSGSHIRPAVAMDPSDTFVVTWTNYVPTPMGSSDFKILGRRFDFNNGPIAQIFQVNSGDYGFQYRPAVDMDGAGRFVVAWRSYLSADTDNVHSVQGQRFCTACDLFADGFESGSTSAWSNATGSGSIQ